MNKRITLTLDFADDFEFANEELMTAALILNSIDFGFAFDCISAKFTIDGLPPSYANILTNKISEREVIINE